MIFKRHSENIILSCHTCYFKESNKIELLLRKRVYGKQLLPCTFSAHVG